MMQSNPDQYTQQFLSNVLSQSGPSSLPYVEATKWTIRQHLLSLFLNYPSLSPKTSAFTHNDGRSVNLLRAEGTLPMFYQGASYNIPVIIWLMEAYPYHAPFVRVNPTRNMVVRAAHPHVDPSGNVSIPYLQEWRHPSCNLVELARRLSECFGRDPPLFTRQNPDPDPVQGPSPSPSPRVSPYPPPGTSFSSNNSNSSLGVAYGRGTGIRPAIPPRAFPQSPYGSGGIIGRRMEDPSEVFKDNAINKLVVSLHNDMDGLRKAQVVDMEAMMNAQGVLREREERLNKGLKEMQDEKEGLEQQLQMLLINSDALEGWLRENEAKLTNLGIVDVDAAFEPCDGLSKQMLDCTASDLAIEDVIYALDKAIQDGVIPFDHYLRNVRLLSREQFFHRATVSKVRAAQMQARVASMASRASPYAL